MPDLQVNFPVADRLHGRFTPEAALGLA